jgi:hypothetical protein
MAVVVVNLAQDVGVRIVAPISDGVERLLTIVELGVNIHLVYALGNLLFPPQTHLHLLPLLQIHHPLPPMCLLHHRLLLLLLRMVVVVAILVHDVLALTVVPPLAGVVLRLTTVGPVVSLDLVLVWDRLPHPYLPQILFHHP